MSEPELGDAAVPMGFLLWYVALLSTYGAFAGVSAEVVFEHRESRRPCDETTIELTAAVVSAKKEFTFRLWSTNTVLALEVIDDDHCRPTWYSRLNVDEIQPICDFFVNQKHFLEDEILAFEVLQKLNLTLVYRFDTETKGYDFRFYINGLLFSTYSNGVVRRIRNSGLSTQVCDTAKEFSRGKAIAVLETKAKELKQRWQQFCKKWERQKNDTDAYKMWHNPDTRLVYCSIQSGLPWWHNISFHRLPSRTYRTYTDNRFLSYATTPAANRSAFTCTVTSPNGMVGIQNFTLGPRPTPGPPRTVRAPDPTTPFDARSVSMTEGSAEMSAVDSSAVAGVVIVIVVIVCVGVFLFVFRERLRALSRR